MPLMSVALRAESIRFEAAEHGAETQETQESEDTRDTRRHSRHPPSHAARGGDLRFVMQSRRGR